MNMAVKTQNSPVLLRRPLPPKILSPLYAPHGNHSNRNGPSLRGDVHQKKDQLAPPVDVVVHDHDDVNDVSDLMTNGQLCKPTGPDPLPARAPRHGPRDNPYELPVDHRFIQSPIFTLDDFLRKWEEIQELRGQSPHLRKIVRDKSPRSASHTQLPQRKLRNQIYVDNTELPNPLARKPQRQIIIELAAAIVSYEGEMLDKKLTEILNQVEIPRIRPPIWTSRALHAPAQKPTEDVSSAYSILEEWNSDLSFSENAGAIDIANFVRRNRKTAGALDSLERTQSDTSPTQVPMLPSMLLRSQGRTSCSSAFENDERLLTPAEFVVFDITIKCSTMLDLRGYFINQLPNILNLTSQLTVVNLSFNNFAEFPSQIFAAENLVSLNLRNNPVKEIPHEIKKLSRLQTLISSFCLISSLPLSLFTLNCLKVLDVSYNCLSFIPNEIVRLRSLVELSVEGNELGVFPAQIINLQLKYFRMMNNFTHPLFWRETICRQPQRLFHMAAQVVVLYSLVNATSDEIKKQLIRPGKCDCCDGPVFGPGVRMIKPFPEIFEIKNLPLLFVLCSQTCRRAFKKDQHAIDNWVKKNSPNNPG